MKYAHLMKVSAEKNNNIEYKMTELEGGSFKIEIAAYGIRPVISMRPMALWERTYKRKLEEGYIDRTEYCTISYGSHHKPITDVSIAALWDELNTYSRNAIAENYCLAVSDVSERMINEVEKRIERLSKEGISLKEFNRILAEIYVIMPRRMKNVQDMIAHDDFEILMFVERERELLDLMKTQVHTESAKITDGMTILESLGLEIRECRESETVNILKHLHPDTKKHFKKAYRVKNADTEDKFWNFFKTHGYRDKDIHYYYHGSRNENWLGILTSGLKLAPRATRNGSMFGPNLYTAPKSDKSQRYTSLMGSYWAHGTSNKGYIAVFKVLYRNPRHITHWDPSMSLITKKNILPYDALYCHGGPGMTLRNDECVLPYEEQVTIQYLIELNI